MRGKFLLNEDWLAVIIGFILISLIAAGLISKVPW